MKIALFGSSGSVATRVRAELLMRGHTITGIARASVPDESATWSWAYGGRARKSAGLLVGHDAVISLARLAHADQIALITAVRRARVRRLLVAGGGEGVKTAPGHVAESNRNVGKKNLSAERTFLNALRSRKKLDWTFLSLADQHAPADALADFGESDIGFRAGLGEKRRSASQKLAIACVDELDSPKHSRQRVAV